MPAPSSYNQYITWVLYAVLGRMAEADDVMNKHGSGIRAVARHLQKTRPPKVRMLYRGLLLEPEEVEEGVIGQDPRLTFVSFSESRDVACWFADPESVMSGFVREHRPDVEGWVMEHKPKLSDILFHHRWNPIALPNGKPFLLERAATMHPHIADQADQFAWNLSTQQEVIIKPLRKGADVIAHSIAECPPTEDLDDQLTPPMFRGQF